MHTKQPMTKWLDQLDSLALTIGTTYRYNIFYNDNKVPLEAGDIKLVVHPWDPTGGAIEIKDGPERQGEFGGDLVQFTKETGHTYVVEVNGSSMIKDLGELAPTSDAGTAKQAIKAWFESVVARIQANVEKAKEAGQDVLEDRYRIVIAEAITAYRFSWASDGGRSTDDSFEPLIMRVRAAADFPEMEVRSELLRLSEFPLGQTLLGLMTPKEPVKVDDWVRQLSENIVNHSRLFSRFKGDEGFYKRQDFEAALWTIGALSPPCLEYLLHELNNQSAVEQVSSTDRAMIEALQSRYTIQGNKDMVWQALMRLAGQDLKLIDALYSGLSIIDAKPIPDDAKALIDNMVAVFACEEFTAEDMRCELETIARLRMGAAMLESAKAELEHDVYLEAVKAAGVPSSDPVVERKANIFQAARDYGMGSEQFKEAAQGVFKASKKSASEQAYEDAGAAFAADEARKECEAKDAKAFMVAKKTKNVPLTYDAKAFMVAKKPKNVPLTYDEAIGTASPESPFNTKDEGPSRLNEAEVDRILKVQRAEADAAKPNEPWIEGMITLHFTQPVDCVVNRFTRFFRTPQLVFYAIVDKEIKITKGDFQIENVEITGMTDYTVNLPVSAARRGAEYAVDRGSFASWDKISPYLAFVTNDVSFEIEEKPKHTPSVGAPTPVKPIPDAVAENIAEIIKNVAVVGASTAKDLNDLRAELEAIARMPVGDVLIEAAVDQARMEAQRDAGNLAATEATPERLESRNRYAARNAGLKAITRLLEHTNKTGVDPNTVNLINSLAFLR